MAEIIQNEGGGKKKGKQRAKKHSTHIDMTPMVDLACLLLTFFMLTTAFSKPKVMEITFPEKQDKDKPANDVKIRSDRTLNIILDENDVVFWYNGLADPRKPPLPTLYKSDYSKEGIRKVLLSRNIELFKLIDKYNTDVTKGTIIAPRDTVQSHIRLLKREDKAGPIVLVKATEKVKYGNIVDIVDELTITNVSRYSIVDINSVELKMIEDYKKSMGI
jgi:biopolymer transport protein ExbD